MADLVDYALWYSEHLNWAVLPLHSPDAQGRCSCGVVNCHSVGKHPRTKNGVHDASKNKSQIQEWWHTWPDANIGLASGKESGVIVIDVDPRNKGNKSIKRLGKPETNVISKTGGGGRHYFLNYSEDPIDAKPADGIDIQSDSRIVVLPPSAHGSGNKYKWLAKPKLTEMGNLPDWAMGDAKTRSKNKPDPRGEYIREGARNIKLTSMAGSLRRIGTAEPEIFAAIWSYNSKWCLPPLESHVVRSIARSIARYEPAQTDITTLNELGLASRFVALFGENIRYSKSLGWLEWNGRFWGRDRELQVRHMVPSLSEVLSQEAEELTNKDEIKLYRSRIDFCSSARGVDNIMKMAMGMPELSADKHGWDSDIWLFNCANGTLDLRDEQDVILFREFRREDYITKIAPVTYDPDARAPLFDKFIRETFNNDVELIGYVQKLLGSALTGDVGEHVFPVCWGVGANGKTTLFEDVTRAVFGTDYRVEIGAEVLLARDSASSSTLAQIMKLKGARVAVASESNRRRLDEEIVKKLTGADALVGKLLYKNPEEFTPTHHIFLITNHKPRVSNSEAIWRRLRLIPFENRVPEDKQDKQLGRRLAAESSGILNWMLTGCLRWQAEGLTPPEAVIEFTKESREEQDILGQFLRDEVIIDPTLATYTADLYESYSMWCATNQVRPLGKINFSREISERFPMVYTAHGYKGARLIGIKAKLTIKNLKNRRNT